MKRPPRNRKIRPNGLLSLPRVSSGQVSQFCEFDSRRFPGRWAAKSAPDPLFGEPWAAPERFSPHMPVMVTECAVRSRSQTRPGAAALSKAKRTRAGPPASPVPPPPPPSRPYSLPVRRGQKAALLPDRAGRSANELPFAVGPASAISGPALHNWRVRAPVTHRQEYFRVVRPRCPFRPATRRTQGIGAEPNAPSASRRTRVLVAATQTIRRLTAGSPICRLRWLGGACSRGAGGALAVRAGSPEPQNHSLPFFCFRPGGREKVMPKSNKKSISH